MEFEWDLIKEKQNVQKHRVTFIEAVETFLDPNGFKLVDRKHSTQEKRYYWIGKSASGRILTTRFTYRQSKIRIIGSAEWRKFKELYYETTKTK